MFVGMGDAAARVSISISTAIGGYDAKRGGTGHCIIANNTLYGNDTKKTGSGEFQIQFNAMHNRFVNNIAYATPQGLLVNDFTASTQDPQPDLDISRDSPAMDTGDSLDQSIVGTVDFAGNPRLKNGSIDLGAFER
jgi:hypothetical protein